MAIIKCGDQYLLPFKIEQGSVVVTPENSTDVRIKIGDYLKSYSASEISFNSTTNCWEYPLTEEMTRSLTGRVPCQLGVKIGDNYVYSEDIPIDFINSIITESWGDGD